MTKKKFFNSLFRLQKECGINVENVENAEKYTVSLSRTQNLARQKDPLTVKY